MLSPKKSSLDFHMVSSGEQEYLTTANCNRPGLPSNSNHARDPAKMFFSYLKKEARQLDYGITAMIILSGEEKVYNFPLLDIKLSASNLFVKLRRK